MISFESDYTTGAHPKILERLIETNFETLKSEWWHFEENDYKRALVGAAGTGKSWMLDNIVKRVMGNIALSVSSKSTEAGIRDNLGGDIRPVVFDEAENRLHAQKAVMVRLMERK